MLKFIIPLSFFLTTSFLSLAQSVVKDWCLPKNKYQRNIPFHKFEDGVKCPSNTSQITHNQALNILLNKYDNYLNNIIKTGAICNDTFKNYKYLRQLIKVKKKFNCNLNNENDLNLQISNNFNDTNSLCNNATIWIRGNKYWDDTKPKLVSKAKELGLNCNTRKKNNLFVNPSSKIVQENNKIVSSEYKNNETFIEKEKKYDFKVKSIKSISSAELEREKQKRKDLEQKLVALEKEKQKRIELEKKLATLQSEKKKQIKKASNEIGSGFYVSKFRHIITNQHVVNQCKKITVGDSVVKQIPADLIASDKMNDLAILKTISMEMASAETKSFIQNLSVEIVPIVSGGLMRSEDVNGGEEIVVAGYPLGNMVSDTIKVTKGIVSATRGMDNNFSQFEIDAVIRKGNSGGPIYDKRGNIVGVAVSRLSVNRTDTINFGIKGSTVKQFLSANDVPTTWANRVQRIDTQDLYKIASKQTVMVVCHR